MASKKRVRSAATDTCAVFESPCITLRVGTGDNLKTFNVHKDLLTSSSEYFTRALKKEWKEGEDNTVNLTEDDPIIFALYLQALYYGAIPVEEPQPKDSHDSQSPMNIAQREHESLCKVYVLAERLQDTKIKNLAILALSEACQIIREGEKRCFPWLESTRIAYEGTPQGSQLRAFIVDCWVYRSYETWWPDNSDSFHKDFLFDVAVGMSKLRCVLEKCPSVVDPSKYFEGTAKEEEPRNTVKKQKTST